MYCDQIFQSMNIFSILNLFVCCMFALWRYSYKVAIAQQMVLAEQQPIVYVYIIYVQLGPFQCKKELILLIL